ncbi:hypothetical protein [Segetibacter sp.]|jgi:hypothetical protein|uniref:hypothetical protein n=1 Tax=Segetibacter sp. TaxID=2231182 RepID=UPI002619D1A1|nr:hypothetical protein [Segetibacter sp.]MCW3079424.1 hypothetical protein [Segetibacter sp.]
MRTALLLLLVVISASSFRDPAPASEKLFKEMIVNRPNHLSQPGSNRTITFQEFTISRPVARTMEYGNSTAQDKNTMVYKVIAKFTLTTENYNTATQQKYSSSSKEYRRAYDFYIDKNNKWVCMALGLEKGLY